MPVLSPEEIGRLISPFVSSPPEAVLARLGVYLDLLIKWNARTNLTAVRDPREIVTRHFGESMFAADYIGGGNSLLDLGSGAGFPGIPIALLRPDVRVTLAESQHKKSAFLREAVRTLELQTEVWAGRVEDLPSARVFDCVTLRAVDSMERAFVEAGRRAVSTVVLLTTVGSLERMDLASSPLIVSVPVPASRDRILAVFSPP